MASPSLQAGQGVAVSSAGALTAGEAAPALSVRDLHVALSSGGPHGRPASVVNGVSLDLHAGRCLCVVGESGSGKTLLAYAIADLLPPVAQVVGGDVLLHGNSLLSMAPGQRRALAGSEIGFVFQEPGTALNPVLTVGWQIAETARIRGHAPATARHAALQLLQQLQVRDAQRVLDAYPHQLSGGMKQRAVMAMALMLDPSLLIADEPTTALDVTVQAEVLQLLRQRMGRGDMSLLFITHDLDVAACLADDLAVMYAGRLVEVGPAEAVLGDPRHPYTQALIAARPRRARSLDRADRLGVLPGQVPAPGQAPAGCAFAPRCNQAEGLCRAERPALLCVAPRADTAVLTDALTGLPHQAACVQLRKVDT